MIIHLQEVLLHLLFLSILKHSLWNRFNFKGVHMDTFKIRNVYLFAIIHLKI